MKKISNTPVLYIVIILPNRWLKIIPSAYTRIFSEKKWLKKKKKKYFLVPENYFNLIAIKEKTMSNNRTKYYFLIYEPRRVMYNNCNPFSCFLSCVSHISKSMLYNRLFSRLLGFCSPEYQRFQEVIQVYRDWLIRQAFHASITNTVRSNEEIHRWISVTMCKWNVKECDYSSSLR